MSIVTTLLSAAAEVEHDGGAVMAQTFIFGLIAFTVFIALALVVFSYRDVANRHAAKAAAYAKTHAAELDHGAGHDH